MKTLSVSLFMAFAVSSSIAGDFFLALDKDGDGNVACDDFASRMAASGKLPAGVDIKGAIAMFDTNGDAQLDSTEFDSMMEYDKEHFINPHTLDFFQTLDSNGDGQLSKLEFLVDVVAIETALGVDTDQDGITSYFDAIDSNGDGNIQLGEFYAIPNAPTDRFVCGGLCVAVGVAAASSLWGYFG